MNKVELPSVLHTTGISVKLNGYSTSKINTLDSLLNSPPAAFFPRGYEKIKLPPPSTRGGISTRLSGYSIEVYQSMKLERCQNSSPPLVILEGSI